MLSCQAAGYVDAARADWFHLELLKDGAVWELDLTVLCVVLCVWLQALCDYPGQGAAIYVFPACCMGACLAKGP